MRAIGIREFKSSLSESLSAVERGERITITRHGKPIAEVVPPPARTESAERQIERLVAQGRLTPAAKPLDSNPPTPLQTGVSASEMILAERRDGR